MKNILFLSDYKRIACQRCKQYICVKTNPLCFQCNIKLKEFQDTHTMVMIYPKQFPSGPPEGSA